MTQIKVQLRWLNKQTLAMRLNASPVTVKRP
jgi:hypothetical protein